MVEASVVHFVLTKIEPPFRDVEADIYVTRGYTAGGCGKLLVTVVWFRVDVAKPRADLRRVFARLRGRAIANATEACGGEKGFVASVECTWSRDWACWQGGGGTA